MKVVALDGDTWDVRRCWAPRWEGRGFDPNYWDADFRGASSRQASVSVSTISALVSEPLFVLA